MPILANKQNILYTGIGYTQSNSDYVYPYQYSGISSVGTLDSDNSWIIKRVDYTIPGSPIIQQAIGSWDNRYLLIYT